MRRWVFVGAGAALVAALLLILTRPRQTRGTADLPDARSALPEDETRSLPPLELAEPRDALKAPRELRIARPPYHNLPLKPDDYLEKPDATFLVLRAEDYERGHAILPLPLRPETPDEKTSAEVAPGY